MSLRIRITILGAVAVLGAIAVNGTGVGAGALARLGLTGQPASAAVHPTYVDLTGRFRSEDGWGVARGLQALTSAVAGVSGSGVSPRRASVAAAATPATWSGYVPLDSSVAASAGGLPVPGCSGTTACGTDGCGFLAPGCALLHLDCSLLNPACGLGVPVTCGLLSGCGFGGEDGFDGGFRFRFRDLFDHHRFFDGRGFDRRDDWRHRDERR